MADQQVNFRFGGNSDDLDKAFTRIKGGFDQLESLAGAVSGAFAFGKIKDGLMSFVEEADFAEAASRKLRGTMMASGQAGDPAAIQEMASALANLTVYQDDTTVEAAAMMSRFQLSQQQIMQMIPAVQDLASFMGQDLVSSADAVGRAVTVGAQGLRALNLGFTQNQRAAFDNATAQERVNMIMAKINATAPGFAQAMAQTAGGAAKIFANNVGEAKEAIGGLLDQPIADIFNAMSDAVKRATTAFQEMSPTAKAVALGLTGLTTAIAAGTAGYVALANGMKLISPIVGPVVSGFARIMNAEISLTGVTAACSNGWKALRTAAVTAWGGIIAPILAVGAAVLAVITLIGVYKRAWDANLGGIRTTIMSWVGSVQQMFAALFKWLGDAWNQVAGFFTEKIVYIQARLHGASGEEASAQGKAAKDKAMAGGGNIFADGIEKLNAALENGKELLKQGGDEVLKDFEAGAKVLGLDKLRDMLGGGDKKAESAIAGGSGGPPPDVEALTIKTAFAGITDKAMKKADQAMANSLVSVLGGGSLKQTAAMLQSLENVSGLSEETLTTILTKTQTGAAGLLNVAETLHGTSDSVVQALLKASGDDMAAVLATAPAIKGMSDQMVTSLLSAGASLDGLKAIAPQVKSMSDGMVQQLVAAGASATDIGTMAKSLSTVSDGTAKAILDTGASVQQLEAMAPYIKGMSDDVVKAIIQADGDSAASLTSIVPHIKGISDSAVKQFLELGGTLEALAQTTDQMRDVANSADTAMQAADSYWKSLKGTLESHGTELAGNLAQGMGQVGGAFTNAMGALQKGDIYGAAISGITSVVTESKSFQALSSKINEIFSNFAQALNPLFDGLSPIFDLIGSLLQAIGGAISSILTGIQPIFALITAVLKPIFSIVNSIFGALSKTFKDLFAPLGSIIKGLMPIFNMISTVFGMLAPILMKMMTATSPLNIIFSIVAAIFKALEPVMLVVTKVLGEAINFIMKIFKILAGAWNKVLGFIADIVQALISKIPGMGDTAKKWADGIRKSEIGLGQFDVAMDQITKDSENQDDSVNNLADSQNDAAKTIDNAGQEIGNAPQGFKVALAEYTAATAVSTSQINDIIAAMNRPSGGINNLPAYVPGTTNPAVQSGQAPGGASVNIYVSNPDPASLAATVQQQLDKQNLQRTGNPLASRLRFAVPPVGSGLK